MDLIKLLDVSTPKNTKDTLNRIIETINNIQPGTGGGGELPSGLQEQLNKLETELATLKTNCANAHTNFQTQLNNLATSCAGLYSYNVFNGTNMFNAEIYLNAPLNAGNRPGIEGQVLYSGGLYNSPYWGDLPTVNPDAPDTSDVPEGCIPLTVGTEITYYDTFVVSADNMPSSVNYEDIKFTDSSGTEYSIGRGYGNMAGTEGTGLWYYDSMSGPPYVYTINAPTGYAEVNVNDIFYGLYATVTAANANSGIYLKKYN